jgi:hypothetical protein
MNGIKSGAELIVGLFVWMTIGKNFCNCPNNPSDMYTTPLPSPTWH